MEEFVPNQNSQECLIITMVGLPARGKSYLSRKLRNFLCWSGLKGKIFNFGMYRRTKLGK